MNERGAVCLDPSPRLWTPDKVLHRPRRQLLDEAVGRALEAGHSLDELFAAEASRQYFMETLAWATADGTAIATSAAETIIYSNITIPANYMADGRRLWGKLFGKFSTTTGPPNLTFRVRWGGVAGTVLAASPAIVTVASVTNAIFMFEFFIETRGNGASGSLMAWLEASLGAATAPTVGSATGSQGEAFGSSAGQTAPAAATVDLTADTALSVTAQWSASSASNTLTGMDYHLVSMN